MVTMETDSRAARPSPFPTVVQFLLVFMVRSWATGLVKEWWGTAEEKALLDKINCQIKTKKKNKTIS